ncbi:nitroreductase family deazaflavin-dependent oxidoreductase [Phytoactinopolyspora mesophila]|uniref:Nitroreductase family deazaflavin-dependent oxidoreductase n=1 Tax=Phytoactinopolyspora mesophila TaxID=2650750 RepID=A0A7K3M0U3_9ACTN|nr:nitroreductase family deazaflavin-dependent oxidoreductase [Phytoactinopolyspora mesophila]NDL56894.1 nitroreductase family deazaflavin-dependent oxidoreductase [Phytoactinopolyspora mesophila]
MSIRRRLARFNRAFANRLVGAVITRLPGFGMLRHRGRRSGLGYRTPVKIFRRGASYIISLPYGADSDWVKNVLAAGECELVTRGRNVRLAEPEVYEAGSEPAIPAPIRMILRWVNATQYLAMKPVSGALPVGEGE